MRISDWSSDVCASDLLAPGVDREHDLVVSFGAEFLGVELQVPRRLLPVDRAAVHAGAEFDQRVEIAAVAAVHLREQPLQRMAAEDLGATPLDGVDIGQDRDLGIDGDDRSEEHTSELQSIMRISYAGLCLKNK